MSCSYSPFQMKHTHTNGLVCKSFWETCHCLLRQIFIHYTAWRKGAPKKVIRRPKAKVTPPTSDKFYSTVWLSDYDSEPEKKLELIASTGTTSCDSHANTPFSSRPTSPFSSQLSSPISSRPNTPSVFSKFEDEDSGLHSENDKSYEDVVGPRKKLHRTLSLPDAELNNLCAEDLQERFSTLQLEQENRELKKLTAELQEALEKLEERVNSLQNVENDSLDEAASFSLTCNSGSHLLENHSHVFLQPDELPQTLKKRSKSDIELNARRRQKRDSSTCCVS